MLQNSRKKRTSKNSPRTRPGGRIQVACINCKDRKLKCDDQIPSCANCDRYGLTCLIEDPTTKRHQPRNYLDTLEERVAFLEGLLQQTRSEGINSSMEAQPAHINDNSSQIEMPKSKEADDDGVNDLASKVGMLGLNAASIEPHYLGSSSVFAFSRIINSSLRDQVPGKFTPSFSVSDDLSISPCLLPDYNTGIKLSNAYFENIHPQYPFLHEPTFRLWEIQLIGSPESRDNFTYDPIALFFVNMVYAVAALLLPNLGSLPQQFYLSAQLHADHVLSLDNLETIQAILCYSMYSLRSPTGTSLWKLSGLALRQCIELGYHRNAKRLMPTTDLLRLEMQKRAFWCTYGIDCAVAITLGRPVGIYLQDVDADFPMDIDDLYITDTGLCGIPRTSTLESSTSMSNAIHVFRLRCLMARIHMSFYSDTTRNHQRPAGDINVKQLRTEIENWLDSAPPIMPRTSDALSIFGSRLWYETNYYYCILLLYRSQLTEKEGVADNVFMESFRAAENICRSYRSQYIGGSVNYTWGSLHLLFIAGLTYLHCLWTSSTVREAVRHDEVSSTCTDCTMVLVVMAERWQSTAPYRDIFEALARRTITMMVDKNHEQWTLTIPSTATDGINPKDLTQWMTDITDMGVSDDIDGLLTGLLNDYTSQNQAESV